MTIQRAMAATLTPNAAVLTFNLAAGANSAPVTPHASVPLLVMGNCTTVGFRGVGQVAMEHTPGAFLQWVGLNSNGTGTITQGFSAVSGTKIVQIDFSGGVNIVVNNADSFVVKNSATAARAGQVTLIW